MCKLLFNSDFCFCSQNPEDFGMFFQWNRKKAWNAVDRYVEDWDNSIPDGKTWKKENDPCPTGWRVPTAMELRSLNRAGSRWTTQNGVYGRLFGRAPNQIFLPATGWRIGDVGRIVHIGDWGLYWSSDGVLIYEARNRPFDIWCLLNGGQRAMYLLFGSTYTFSDLNVTNERTGALPIRCVAK